MIDYTKFTLDNGLRVIVHKDTSTPIVAFNIAYDVGARDEDPELTGLAHYFEHLMFGGSKNIPDFDPPLQEAGGENNAFTSNDYTNYYITIPKENLETAFWLESDRMQELAFTEKSLEVQRKVVIEEFKQRYLNQPYGNVWMLLRELCFKVHPYKWATIGKEIAHIEKVTMENVKDFFYNFYRPNNAILTICGDVEEEEIITLTQKWFGSIPSSDLKRQNYRQEPEQNEARFLEVEENVPTDMLLLAYHTVSRTHDDYFASDLISDILSGGPSSKLYQKLVKEEQIASEVNAYITGDRDKGLFIISAKPTKGNTLNDIEQRVYEILTDLAENELSDLELDKVKNKYETAHIYGEFNVLNKAMNLTYNELIGDVDRINKELDYYSNVSANDIKRVASYLFDSSKRNVLYYKAKENG